MQSLLELSHVSFSYGKNHILKDLSLKVNAGSICCILGPSGCGKTSLIRMVAGFEQPSSGKILMASEIIADAQINKSAEQRNIGMVFQDLTLFPHLTVEKNIGFGLEHQPAKKRQQRIDELIELCRLNDLRTRYPHQISGGQQQRVALARALAPKPQLLLLDEPFSSVDSSLQRQLCQEVRNVLLADNATAIWVTHDLEEAFTVSDHVGLIIEGELQQWSAPQQLYDHPANLKVARFLNHGEVLTARFCNEKQVETAVGLINVHQSASSFQEGPVKVLINKRHFHIDTAGNVNARLTQKAYLGGHYLLTVIFDNGETVSFFSENHQYTVNDKLSVAVRDQLYHCF